ncbi:class I SAM-dependent methyltransferase [Herbaspirillum lusitanum]|uniref:class I SAM-dependent methyltransferase n=1 Tax=Herbaspirillum lusitanum TaxID=213312 RepID=UPI002237F3F8|nr:class I SAM-dependent methyltransferase [Herbaspirillum lusitanum]MCW5297765.1 class I SAM-dependent methyltransferase [Herbaspirillum lusitanum]
MRNWHNNSGKPLASDDWLEAHHYAKLPERTAFAQQIAAHSPRRIVDLGCGTGLWLELCAEAVDAECELIGIDLDPECLQKAKKRLQRYSNPKQFLTVDIENNAAALPDADIYLAFNIFPYISDLPALLRALRRKILPGGSLVVRQYDGALLRVGPMDNKDRQIIDTSLMAALAGSEQFKHYDLDRVFETLRKAEFFECQNIDFETFRRVSPYPEEFKDYFLNTMNWTSRYVSEDAAERLISWMENKTDGASQGSPSYFVEVDLIAWLS